jgi:prevent-host-death family protein
MPIYNVLEAKTNLSKLIDAVESGRESEIVIARNGKPAARLVALARKSPGPRIGVAKGRFKAPADIDGTNSVIAQMFNGGDG